MVLPLVVAAVVRGTVGAKAALSARTSTLALGQASFFLSEATGDPDDDVVTVVALEHGVLVHW